MPETMNAMLVLEDGSAFAGRSFGASGEWIGEVVFNTGMTGYQEVITDPSYWGQMVCFTCPHIGNVGINREDAESKQPYVRAVLARQICEQPSNWRAQQPLPEYLRAHGIPALSGLDTRRLTLTLRQKGVMRAALSTVNLDAERLRQMAQNAPDMSDLVPVDEVTLPRPAPWGDAVVRRWRPELGERWARPKHAPHIGAVDCGIKMNQLRLLVDFGARVTVAPANAPSELILAMKPDGVFISNGPGDPVQAPETAHTVRELLGKVPIYGICLGHQIIALASGARTYKLPFGHHGVNHPVQDLTTGRIEITSQNHNFAVDKDSLAGLPLEITHINLYDNTIEGLRRTDLPVACVQYHPEASPGPHDSLEFLRRFVQSL